MAIAKLKNFPENVRNFLPTVAVIVCLIFATSGIFEFYLLNSELKEQEKYIFQNREQEIIKISPVKPVPEIISKINGRDIPLITHFGGVTENVENCYNVAVSRYCNAKKIVAVP